jgi:1-acyl-sn-glycerol-3-phosphate acyltransferase
MYSPKTMIRALVYYLMLTMFTYMYNIIASVFYLAKKLFNVGEYDKVGYYYAHAYFLILKMAGVNLFVNNRSSQPSPDFASNRMLWISNHRSKFDGLVALIFLRLAGSNIVSVTKKSVSYLPIFNSFSKHIGLIFIKRTRAEAEKVLTDEAIESMATGKSILIFPEGTTLSPATRAYSDKYATENNLGPLQNVILPKTTGYEIVQREGKFGTTGNITIRYCGPEIPPGAEHSYGDLFTIFPTEIYFEVDSSDNIRPENLYQVFSDKDTTLKKPIAKNDYRLMDNYSGLCLGLNLASFIIFYYLICNVPLFGYATLAINVVTSVLAMAN